MVVAAAEREGVALPASLQQGGQRRSVAARARRTRDLSAAAATRAPFARRQQQASRL